MEQFTPGRPSLPLYLFVLCMELLGQNMHRATQNISWKLVKASRTGPGISHIFFARDLILFGETMLRQANVMANIMAEFCEISGQKVNTQKSKLFTSRNTEAHIMDRLHQNFEIPTTTDLGLYLGMPIVHGRKSWAVFEFILTKVRKHLIGWKKWTLSLAARGVLIQSVTSSIPSYVMQTIQFPISLLDKLDKIDRRFFWGGDEHHRRMHTIAWNNICRSNGLKDRKIMNHALPVKLIWRMIPSPDSL